MCPEKIHGTGWWDRESFLEEEASGLSSKDPMIKTCQVRDTRGKGTCRQTEQVKGREGWEWRQAREPLLSLDKSSVRP